MKRNNKNSSKSATQEKLPSTLTRTKSVHNLERTISKPTSASRGRNVSRGSRDDSQPPISRWLGTRPTHGSIVKKRSLEKSEEELELAQVLRRRLEEMSGTRLEPALVLESVGKNYARSIPSSGLQRSMDSESSLSSTECTSLSDLSSSASLSSDLQELESPPQWSA